MYGYQLKEGSTVPERFAYEEIFHKSYLIRGAATKRGSSIRLWQSVSDSQLDNFLACQPFSDLQNNGKSYRKQEMQTVLVLTKLIQADTMYYYE